MACKIVKDYIEGNITMDNLELVSHLESCESCRKLLEIDEKVNQNLEELFGKKSYNPVLKDNIFGKVNIKPKKPFIALIACLLLITIVFNKDIVSFAEQIPFVQDIIKIFQRDEKLENAIEEGYPIYEISQEKEGYKLLINDVLLDSFEFEMQLTVQDKEGNHVESGEITFKMPTVTRDSYTIPIDAENPWFRFSHDLVGKTYGMETFDLDVEAVIGNQVIAFDRITFDLPKSSTFKNKYIKVMETIELPTGLVEITSIEIGETTIVVKLKNLEQYDATDHMLDLVITDNKGHSIANKSTYKTSSNPYYTMEFLTKDFDVNTNSITLKCWGYSYRTVTSTSVTEDSLLNFEHMEVPFVIDFVYTNQKTKHGYMKTEMPIDSEIYPSMAVKVKENWIEAIVSKPFRKHHNFTLEQVNDMLGETIDPTDIDQIKKLHQLFLEDGINLDLEDLIENIEDAIDYGDFYVIDGEIFLIDNARIQYDTILPIDGLEWGVVGERKFENFEKVIKIDVID